MNSPCKRNGIDYPKRHMGCHDDCKEYQDFSAERERIRQRRQAELKERDFFFVQCEKNKKRKGK